MTHEIFEGLRRVAYGVSTYHDHLNIICAATQALSCQLDMSHRQRTFIGAIDIAEIKQYYFAALAAQVKGLSVLIG